MIWVAIAALAAAGVAMIIRREAFSRMQAMLLGGNIAPGCAIAEAVVFFALAALVFAFRALLR